MDMSTNRRAIGILVGLSLLGSLTACGSKSTPVASNTTKAAGSATTAVASTKADATSTTKAAATTSTEPEVTTTTTAGDSGGGAIDQGNGDILTAPKVVWTSDASEYNDKIGVRVRYACPKDGTFDTVWGTDVYTDDSSVCTAAVHAGLITVKGGGTVVIKVIGPKDSYAGSTSNGVTTESYGSWGGSFIFPDKQAN